MMIRFIALYVWIIGFGTSNAFRINPIQKFCKAVNRVTDRTVIVKDIKTPDPIPEEGQNEALRLMQSGRLYRYNVKAEHDSIVSKCEAEIAAYTGHKYCVALNSCGSALMLMMKATGVKHGVKVFSNAFTFGAVPSAIEHAGGSPIYVESNIDMVIDIDDFKMKVEQNPDCKHAMISHMRGKVADMNTIKDICEMHGVTLVEDCAHSLGVLYDGQHTGHVGVACGISSQSYKMINSGEGGFLLTNDPEIAARAAVYAGAYENLFEKHTTVPNSTYFHDLPTQIPNYSLRMSALTASIITPQIKTIDRRITKYNQRYNTMVKRLEARVGKYISIPQLTQNVDRMVHDSLQFLLDESFTTAMISNFLDECISHGLPVELFGDKANARNFANWNFAPSNHPLPQTAAMLARACDIRLPIMWDDEDFEDMANVISESIEKVVSDANATEK